MVSSWVSCAAIPVAATLSDRNMLRCVASSVPSPNGRYPGPRESRNRDEKRGNEPPGRQDARTPKIFLLSWRPGGSFSLSPPSDSKIAFDAPTGPPSSPRWRRRHSVDVVPESSLSSVSSSPVPVAAPLVSPDVDWSPLVPVVDPEL